MFILRSAFWLTIGFFLVAPHGTDFGAAATSLRDQAVEVGLEAGSQLVVSQINAQTLPALIELATPTRAQNTIQQSPVGPTVLPRPRPAALG
jgi:hypothetical protein